MMLQMTRQSLENCDQADTPRRGSPSSADSSWGSWGSNDPPSLPMLPGFYLHTDAFQHEAAIIMRDLLQGRKYLASKILETSESLHLKWCSAGGVHSRYQTGHGNQTDATKRPLTATLAHVLVPGQQRWFIMGRLVSFLGNLRDLNRIRTGLSATHSEIPSARSGINSRRWLLFDQLHDKSNI